MKIAKMKLSPLMIAGAGVALVGGYFLLRAHDKSVALQSTILKGLQPSGTPYMSPAGLIQKVQLGFSDGTVYTYVFPIQSLPNLSQLQGKKEPAVAAAMASLGGIPSGTALP